MDAAADCHNPVCGSKADMFRNSMGGGQKKPPPGAAPKRGVKDAGKQHDGSAVTAASATTMPCPADREELGRQSWTLVRVALAYAFAHMRYPPGVHLVTSFVCSSQHALPCPLVAYLEHLQYTFLQYPFTSSCRAPHPSHHNSHIATRDDRCSSPTSNSPPHPN